MKTLAIDTSTHVMGVALAEEDKVLGEYVTNVKKNHSLRLMPAIHQLFEELEVKPEELDCIAVAKGPGSYTGVRIGVTTAKSMAWSLGIPVCAISTLQLLARNGKHFSGLISPFIDARRGQVYTGLYKTDKARMQVLKEDHIVLMNDWLDYLKEQDEFVLFLSQDESVHRDHIYSYLAERAVFGDAADMIPKPGELAVMAFEHKNPMSAHLVVPEYTQRTEAEKKWLAAKEGKMDE